jgi:hypothetical protein
MCNIFNNEYVIVFMSKSWICNKTILLMGLQPVYLIVDLQSEWY